MCVHGILIECVCAHAEAHALLSPLLYALLMAWGHELLCLTSNYWACFCRCALLVVLNSLRFACKGGGVGGGVALIVCRRVLISLSRDGPSLVLLVCFRSALVSSPACSRRCGIWSLAIFFKGKAGTLGVIAHPYSYTYSSLWLRWLGSLLWSVCASSCAFYWTRRLIVNQELVLHNFFSLTFIYKWHKVSVFEKKTELWSKNMV